MKLDPVEWYANGGVSGMALAAHADQFSLEELRSRVPVWKYWIYLDAVVGVDGDLSSLIDDLVSKNVSMDDPEFRDYESFVRGFPETALRVLVEQRRVLEAQHLALRSVAEEQMGENRRVRREARARWKDQQSG